MGVCTASLLAVPELAIAKRENVLQQAALKSVVLDICRIYFAYEMRLRGGIIGNSACIVGYKASFLSLLIETQLDGRLLGNQSPSCHYRVGPPLGSMDPVGPRVVWEGE